jgi:hypothetical protein
VTDGEPRHLLLRHREVDVDRVERLQRDYRVAALKILAEVHLPQAQDARERRPDPLALDGRADLADSGFRLLRRGLDLIELRLRGHALLMQVLHPFEVEAG